MKDFASTFRFTNAAWLLALVGLLTTASAAEKVLFDFDEDFDVAGVATTDVKLSRRGAALRLAAGHKAIWPGIALSAPAGHWDLSTFEHIALDVKNVGSKSVEINCRVDDPDSDASQSWITGRTSVKPGQQAVLIVPLTRKIPAGLRSKLFGMRGYPGGWSEKQGIDTARVSRLVVYLHQPSVDHTFEIANVRSGGRRGEALPTNADALFPMIDRYGQFLHKDWPGKTRSPDDFATHKRQEAKDLAAHPGSEDWNQYGGWKTGPQLEASGRFRVQGYRGKWWLVDPKGRLFWSHGVDCVRSTTGYTPVTDREHWFTDLPAKDSPFGQFYGRGSWAPHGYYQDKGTYETYNFTAANLLQKYGDRWKQRFAELCHRRLRSWGMNTIANWSDPAVYLMRKTPYVATISANSKKIEGSAGYWGKFPDVFDPDFKRALKQRMDAQRETTAGDPWCLGYFVGNELSWGNETSLAAATLASPPGQAAKKVFVDNLRAKYPSIEQLNRAWQTKHASWEALLQSTTPPDVNRAREDLIAFYTTTAEEYFRVCNDVVKEVDPTGLYLGCRFAWVNNRAVRASAKYCDVVSFNQYKRSVDGLGLPEGVDKPVIIGEFHFGALDRGMLHTGLVKVADQQQRAAAYQRYVRGALANRYIVGTHWFQFGDQATTGRGDGENYQIGLLDVCDTPYPETIQAVRQVGYEMYAVRNAPVKLRVKQGIDTAEIVLPPVDWVDPMLGTATSRWMLYPGPSTPFSMVKLSPDNQRNCWKAGYEYTIENIAGFSHIHSWTMGGLLTMPTTGQLKVVPGPEQDPDAGYRSRFSHDREVASPGYYAVTLEDYGIRAELTSTPRTGMQRYTFPKSDQARILFDLLTPTEYNYDVLDARVTKVSDTEIEGYSKQRGARGASWNDYTVHFVARLSRPFDAMGGWAGGKVLQDVDQITGKDDVGAFLSFSTAKDEVVLLQTGISLVSIEQARLNLETETASFGWDFDTVRHCARNTWNDLLGTIEVEGGTPEQMTKFYTNMYRSYCARTIWNDVNGKYVDMYEKVQQLKDPDSAVYGCDAFWNTFWNLNQLWTLVHPEVANKWAQSLLEISDRGGWLAKGPTGIEYSSIMVASHEIALIVSAYQKGIRGFDAEKAYQAMRFIQMEPGRPHEGGGHVGNRQLKSYMELGYVPVEKGPVSNTLEYAYDDWCVAQMAKALGKQDDYELFMKRAGNYRNVFDPAVGYMRQRHQDGSWVKDFSPFASRGFVEGNSWQFTWFVPHDVQGLIGLLGTEEFNRRLNKGLEDSAASNFNATHDRFADFPINHGNQPNMQSAWLFNFSGAPWLTQKWTREIMRRYYGTGPADGYPGDEDQGQMGAWYVMSAMGLFEMDGGCAVKPIYEIGSPIFDKITIHLDGRYYKGGQFVIETKNNSKTNRYIQSATLDGQPLDQPWLYHRQLVDGGTLVLQMGPKPNKKWGSAPEAAPPQN